ncbi:MAG: hypothetical protein U0R50_10185 [Gaiellales bacterium]
MNAQSMKGGVHAGDEQDVAPTDLWENAPVQIGDGGDGRGWG